MKKIYFLLTILVCSLQINAQEQKTSLKSKVVTAFTKKKQIAVLNHKVDSLNNVIKAKDIQISDVEDQNTTLNTQITQKNSELSVTNNSIHDLELQLNHKKITLDSLNKVITENQAYSIFQRNEDSLRYQNLLHKLSERNTFIVDSLKMTQNIKKGKQEPTKVETYYFKDFKSVITGVPDEKNRFTYTFELFQKKGEEYVKAENSAPFNEKKQELLDLINKKIQKDFTSSYKIDPKCFTSKTPPTYDFKNLGVEFKDGKINFYAVFDFTTTNCYYLYGYTSVEFTFDELKSYLK
jgi:hypothetical protein